MIYAIFILAFFLAIISGAVVIPNIIRVSFRKRLFDKQDIRKRHKGVVPRLGGMAFVPVQFCLFAFITVCIEIMDIGGFPYLVHLHHKVLLLVFCALVMLFMVGVVDDLITVGYRQKFIIQLLAASLLPLGGLWMNNLYGIMGITEIPIWIGVPLTIFSVMLIVNSVNLIDGLDGLCSGLVATGCLILGVLFLVHGAFIHALFALVTAGVLIPFFYYNVFGVNKRRHRIFMGDTGSLTLGYSLAFLALSYTTLDPTIKPFSEGAIVVAYSTVFIPVMDVATVMWTRIRQGKSPFLPDRNHIHHKMLRLGMTHHQAMVCILCIAFCFGGVNVVLVEYISNNLVLLFDVLMWIVMQVSIAHFIAKREYRMKQFAKKRISG